MSRRLIDMNQYPRREHFAHFCSLAYPYVGLTAEVDVTDLVEQIKGQKLPVFLTFCYVISQAANNVPELRQRIADGKIVEYDRCITSHTLALEDGTYCYCELETDMPYGEFVPYARQVQEDARNARSLTDEGDANRLFFFSTLPWMTFTGVVQPTPYPADSNPRMIWGKYHQREGRTVLPLSLQCHHALVDGLHIGQFFENVQGEAAALAAQLKQTR